MAEALGSLATRAVVASNPLARWQDRPITLSPVDGRLTSPLLDGNGSGAPPEPAPRAASRRAAMMMLAVGAAAIVVFREGGVVVLVAVLVIGGWVLHRLDVRVSFGFGDGFLGFRSDPGWPRGVQEDDDFRWSWSATDGPPGSARQLPARR